MNTRLSLTCTILSQAQSPAGHPLTMTDRIDATVKFLTAAIVKERPAAVRWPLLAVALLLPGLLWAPGAEAESQSSENYRIDWDVVDAGGIAMGSASYSIVDSPAQSTPLGLSGSTNYELSPGFLAAPDTDVDSYRDFLDNCILDANPSQLDTNGDGFGNMCDPDINNDGTVNFLDYAPFTTAFLSTPGDANWNPDADLTGDNVVNFFDIFRFQLFFLSAPGPSGIN